MTLVLVLVVVAMLTLAAFAFFDRMFLERRAAAVGGSQAQARAAAESGVEFAKFFLSLSPDDRNQQGGCYDNPPRFLAVPVAQDADPRKSSRFAIVAPLWDDRGAAGVRFGLEDESAKLNINALLAIDKASSGAGKKMLMALPGMTDEIADAILDWLDPDDDTRENGAESSYYASLVPPYAPKNGPLDTVEELLLVRGVTPALLFGSDTNRNGLQDVDEAAAETLDGLSSSDGSMTCGWAGLLTVHSLEMNLRPDGSPKIDLNQSDLTQLSDQLNEALGQGELVTFILAYRQKGAYTGTKTAVPMPSKQLDLSKAGGRKLRSVLDLIDAKVEIQFVGDRQTTVVASPLTSKSGGLGEPFTKLMQNCTTAANPVIVGRLNINQAPRVLLQALPGMTDDIVDAILSNRTVDPINASDDRKLETWILSEGIVTLQQMKTLMPFVTAGGSVYRAHVVGYFDRGGVAARVEAMIDASAAPPKLIFWRDLSHLGRGYGRDILGP